MIGPAAALSRGRQGTLNRLVELVAQTLQATLGASQLTCGGQLHAGMREQQSLLLDAPAELTHRLPQPAMP